MTDHNAVLTEIIKVAAYLAQGAGLPSYDKDDHKRHVPAWLLTEIEKAADDLKVQATALKRACDNLRPALTTPPAPTVTGDDVREAVAIASKGSFWKELENGSQHAIDALDTLIRAATQPPLATDAQKRAYELLERIDVQCQAVGHPVGGINEIKAIISAIQSTAVPREVIEILEEAKRWKLHPAHVAGCIDKALALLGGKERE